MLKYRLKTRLKLKNLRDLIKTTDKQSQTNLFCYQTLLKSKKKTIMWMNKEIDQACSAKLHQDRHILIRAI